jgi:hypothetical protein
VYASKDVLLEQRKEKIFMNILLAALIERTNWEDGARDKIRNVFNSIGQHANINRFQVPVFCFCIVILVLMQVLGAKLDKPIINVISFIVVVVMLMYFGFI